MSANAIGLCDQSFSGSSQGLQPVWSSSKSGPISDVPKNEIQLEMVTYDIYGTIVSTKSIGTHSSYEKTIVDYQMDGSENVYILCNERLEFYKSRVVLQKFTSDGDLVWEETIQNEADTSFMAQHLVLASDGRLVLASYREYDYPAPGDDYIVTVTIPQLFCYDAMMPILSFMMFSPWTERCFCLGQTGI